MTTSTETHSRDLHKPGMNRPFSKVVRYIISLSAFIAIVRIAGFVEKQTLAYFFGTGASLDAFFVAISVPMMASFVVAGILGQVFLPFFLKRLADGEAERGWSQFNGWILIVTALLALVIVASYPALDHMVRLLAPGFNSETHDACVRMLRWMLPLSLPMGLAPLLATVSNGLRSFWIAPAADLFVKIVLIGFLALYAGTSGIDAAAWGTAVGSIACLAVFGAGLKPGTQWLMKKPELFSSDQKKMVLIMSAPAVGMIFSQIGTIAENAACSYAAEGAVAAITFSRKLINLPLLVVSVASGTVLYTYFSELGSARKDEAMAGLLAISNRAMLFLFLPIMAIVMAMPRPLVALVFERGAFSPDSTLMVAFVLFWLAPLLPFSALETVIMRHFFSRVDVWPPILVGIASVFVRVAIILIAVYYSAGLAGIALASVISKALKVIALIWLVGRRGGLPVRAMGWNEVTKFLTATAVAYLGVLGVTHLLFKSVTPGLLGNLLIVCAGGTVGIGLYVSAAMALRSTDCRTFLAWRPWH